MASNLDFLGKLASCFATQEGRSGDFNNPGDLTGAPWLPHPMIVGPLTGRHGRGGGDHDGSARSMVWRYGDLHVEGEDHGSEDASDGEETQASVSVGFVAGEPPGLDGAGEEPIFVAGEQAGAELVPRAAPEQRQLVDHGLADP